MSEQTKAMARAFARIFRAQTEEGSTEAHEEFIEALESHKESERMKKIASEGNSND